MKDEEFQLDSAESKNTLLTNMFTGTALFISFLVCSSRHLPCVLPSDVYIASGVSGVAGVEHLGPYATTCTPRVSCVM